MWKVILLCTFVGLTAGQKVSYEDYQLFRVLPNNEYKLSVLKFFYDTTYITEFDFWAVPSTVNKYVEIMVPVKMGNTFKFIMNDYNIYWYILSDNVEWLINTLMRENDLVYDNYRTLDDIHKSLFDLVFHYPNRARIIVGGKTHEGQDILGVKLSFKPNNTAVFLEGGSEARHWVPPAVVLYILDELLTSKNEEIREIAESFDWYIFPTFNPDGYNYTHTTDRLWKRNLRQDRSCLGVDLNRNWAYNWNSLSRQCCYKYSGPEPFSEIETKSMSEYIESIHDKLFGYFSFHYSSNDLTYPTKNTIDIDTKNNMNMLDIARVGLNYSLQKQGSGIPYTHNILEANDGGSSVSYIKNTYDTPVVFSYGLKDRYNVFSFLQPSVKNIRNEALYSLMGILKEAKHRFLSKDEPY